MVIKATSGLAAGSFDTHLSMDCRYFPINLCWVAVSMSAKEGTMEPLRLLSIISKTI